MTKGIYKRGLKEIIQSGDKFGRLTAIEFAGLRKNSQHWLFRCNCGNKKVVRAINVKNGNTKSCGCLNKEVITKHGMKNTKTWNSWRSMRRRCLDKNATGYKYWGGRGIIICNSWLKFENFYADMGERPKGKTLDRIDNNGNYCKSNCKWSSPKEQMNNRNNSKLKAH